MGAFQSAKYSSAKAIVAVVLSVLLATSLFPVGALQAFAETVDQVAVEQGESSSPSQEEETGSGFDAAAADDSDFDAMIELGAASGSSGSAGSSAGSDGAEPDAGSADDPAASPQAEILLDLSSGSAVISGGGVYRVPEGAGGVIAVTTADPVTLIGNGVRWDDSFGITSVSNAELRIDCTQTGGVDLTLKSIHIANAACAADGPMLDFAGSGNALRIEGTVLLEQAAPDGACAMIHVPEGAGLVIGGDGYLYLSGDGRGAVMGGSAFEANGSVSFGDAGLGVEAADLAVFGKAEGAGALVGSGADVSGDAVSPGAIAFNQGVYSLVSASGGAVLGSASLPQASAVIVGGEAAVSVNADGTAPAICASVEMRGGSLRSYVTASAAEALGVTAGLNDALTTGAVRDESGSYAYKCVFDTDLLTSPASGFSVSVDGELAYQGGLHCFGYAQEFIDGGDVSTVISTTPSNWYACDDSCLFLYLTGVDHLITVNGESFLASFDESSVEDGSALTAGAFALEPFDAAAMAEGEQQVKVSFAVELDGVELSREDYAGLVTFSDPSAADPAASVDSLSVEPGERISLGVQLANPAKYAVEGLTWEYAAEMAEGYPVTVALGNVLELQSDGTYLSDREIGTDVVVRLSLATLDPAARAFASGEAGGPVGGTVLLSNRDESGLEAVHAAAGDMVEVSPVPDAGYYLAQVRWAAVPAEEDPAGADGSEEGAEPSVDEPADLEASDEPLAFTVIKPADDGGYSFVMPDGASSVVVYADFVPVVWDGSIDVTWYDPDESYFEISYPAQYAGLAAIVNGIFTTYPTAEVPVEGSSLVADVPDYDAYKEAMGVVEEPSVDSEGNESSSAVSSEYYGEFTSTYCVALTQGAASASDYGRSGDITRTTRVIGNPGFIQLNSGEGTVTEESQNLRTSSIYYYGRDDFKGKRVEIMADLDFGAWKSGGVWDVSSPLYMPVGGQFAMLPGYSATNAYSILGSSWNGVLDGNGHSFSNVFCEYYASGSNYGDSVSIGLIGRMGNHDDEDASKLAVDPAVRQIVFESGYVSGRRSVGGIVGKIGQTTASKSADGSTGGIVEYCVNYADVQTTDKKGAGGIVGAAYNAGVIRYCANFGSVTSLLVGGTNAGGIAGLNEITILSCYNVGAVSAKVDSFACAITTNNGGGDVINCYWLSGSAKGKACYDAEKTDTIYEFGSGDDAKYESLSAELLNGDGSKVWTDESSANVVGGVAYPGLFFQADGYDPDDYQYEVTVVQPSDRGDVGGTLSASPVKGDFGDTVNLASQADAGYILDYYYTIDPATGKETKLVVSSFALDSDVMVSARFREKKAIDARIWGADWSGVGLAEAYDTEDVESFMVRKDGVVRNADGTFAYVEGCALENGELIQLYEGDVLSYEVKLVEGAVPDDYPYKGYNGSFRVDNFDLNNEYVYFSNVYPDSCQNYIVKGDEGTLWVYLATLRTERKSWSHLADTSWYDAENPADTYEIGTPEEFAGVAKLVNDGVTDFEGVTLTLACDISLDDGTGYSRVWEPIGSKSTAFSGTFDGAGHSVSALTVDTMYEDPGVYVGLFGSLEGAEVRGLHVEGSIEAGSYVGGIAGSAADSLIEDCSAEVVIRGRGQYAGGIAGCISGSSAVRGCVNRGAVSGIGDAGAKVENFGGIVGLAQTGTAIEGCSNRGAVSLAGSADGQLAGGIVGKALGAKVSNCLNAADVTGSSRTSVPVGYVGGIAGVMYSGSEISACANKGSVEGRSLRAGGIAGHMNYAGTIEDCYNRGYVSSDTDGVGKQAGGIVGFVGGTSTGSRVIADCYSAGMVSAPTAGAVIGQLSMATTASNVHFDADLCGTGIGEQKGTGSSVDITACTSAAMRALAPALNGDGGSAWEADAFGANGGYPLLSWELPYRLTFKDAAGAVLASYGMPAGLSLSSADVSALCSSEGIEDAGLPEGYVSEFAFWSATLNGSAALAIDAVSSDVTAWPSFKRTAVSYSITYDLAGGVNAADNPSTYTVERLVKLSDPVRDDWRFTYWTTDEGAVIDSVGKGATVGDLHLTANWSDSDTCVVLYMDASGVMKALSVKPGTLLSVDGEDEVRVVNYDITIPNPDREPAAGYGTVGYVVSETSGGGIRLKVADGSSVSYSISYDAAGGDLVSGSPASFTVETSGLILTAPVRSGYAFQGWEDGNGKVWGSIPKGTVGDLALTARWARDLSAAEVTGLASSYMYDGAAIALKLTVVHDGVELVEGLDYEVAFEGNQSVGTARALVSPVGEGCVGVWEAEFAITMPSVTDAEEGVSISGLDLLKLREVEEGTWISTELSVDPFGYARKSELRSQLKAAGYNLHDAFGSELLVTSALADGTQVTDKVTDGFGVLTLSVPVELEDGKTAAVYWLNSQGDLEAVSRYVEVIDGKVSFDVTALGDFVIISRLTLSGLVDGTDGDDADQDGSSGGVSVQKESASTGGGSVKTSTTAEKTSSAGTVNTDAKADEAKSSSSAGAAAADGAEACDGCLGCSGPMAGFCDDLCSEENPCPWCSAAPVAGLLVLAGIGVAAWALFMRLRRPKPDSDYGF